MKRFSVFHNFCISVLLSSVSAVSAAADLSVEVSNSVYAVTRDSVEPTSNNVQLQYDSKDIGDDSWVVHMGILINPNEKQQGVYPNLKEFYKPATLSDNSRVSFGKKLHQWSRLDETYGLGVWQPQLRADYLKPEQQAFLGAHYEWKTRYFSSTVMVSPLFIPDMGPQFSNENGKISSANPWFQDQPTMLRFNTEIPLDYNVEIPNLGDVAANTSFAMNIRYSEPKNKTWVSASYAFKPMNQLHLKIEPFLLSNPSVGKVNIYPGVVYHQVATLEMGVRSSAWDFWVSYNYDQPIAPKIPSNWYDTPLTTNRYFGGQAAYNLKGIGLAKSSIALGTYTRWIEARERVADNVFGEIEMSEATGRIPFRNALILEVKTADMIRNVKLFTKYTLGRDKVAGSIISGGFEYSPKRNWMASLSFDVITAEEEDPNSFFSYYRSNDRITGGLKYVF